MKKTIKTSGEENRQSFPQNTVRGDGAQLKSAVPPRPIGSPKNGMDLVAHQVLSNSKLQGPSEVSPFPVTEFPRAEIKTQERYIAGVDQREDIQPDLSREPLIPGVDSGRVAEFNRVLQRYKAGKASVDRRVIEAEKWWKMRHSFEVSRTLSGNGKEGQKGKPFEAVTGWLHNVIVSKHADGIEAYPEANILPREENDRVDAWMLSKIIPVILEQNEFEHTYSDCLWQKLKTGTGVYMVTWDNEKLNGLGDISIKKGNLLNIFWEPGVDDIQESRFVFHVVSEDKDVLRNKYPNQLANEPNVQSGISLSKMPGDDSRDDSTKADVVDVYYKRDGKLHFCKYVGNTVLYATENDPVKAQEGLYTHGLFPFVFDPLFPIEESPAGYGYVDICSNAQTRIDMLSTATIRNAVVGALPRYFQRMDGAVNEEEFMDLSNPLVHVSGNLGEDSLRLVDYKPLNGNYINCLNNTVDELRETSSNTETSTGSSTNGVTAASAFAALQEAAGKTSRDSTKASYRCYRKIVHMVIELIRQFYDMPRQFRITGAMGVEKFVTYTNAGLKPIAQGTLGDIDLGERLPVFDIRVVPEKESSYTKLARNEMALQFYGKGFFNPELAQQSMMCLEMMDFDGKDELMQKLSQQANLWEEMQRWKSLAVMLAAECKPQLVPGLLGQTTGQPMPKGKGGKAELKETAGEASHVSKARERAQTASQPGGSAV